MVKFSIAFIGIVLLMGCTSKTEKVLMETYSQDISYHKQLQKTEKTLLYKNDQTEVMLTATYLYTPIDELHDLRDEEFVVGVHLNEKAYGKIDSSDYNLTLNGQAPKSIQKLALDDERLKELSFVTQWADYYLVTFPHESSKKITLVYEHKMYGKGILHFAKVAKYILSKEAF